MTGASARPRCGRPRRAGGRAAALAALALALGLGAAGCEARGRVAWSDPVHFGDGDLVAYFKLDEIGGDVVRDSSGRGHHGTARGSVAFVPGRFSNGLALDGRSWIEIPAAPDLQLVRSFTLAAWVKPQRLEGAAGLVALSDGARRGCYLALDGDSLESGWDADLAKVAIRGGVIAPGGWLHVAATVDEALNTRLYVDGQLVATARAAYSPGQGSSPLPLLLGRLGDATPFQGVLDEVRVYARALSDEAVRALAGRWSNEPPEMVTVASARPAVQAVGLPVTLSARATDPEGDPITYVWTLEGGSRHERVGSGDLVHTFDREGIHVAWVSISDGLHPEIRANPVTVVVGPTQPSPSVAYGLIADWPIDEDDVGGAIQDHTGHGHTATLGPGASIFQGDEHRRPVLQFEDDADPAEVAPAPDLSLAGDVTISAWIKPARLGPYGVVRQAGAADSAGDPGDGLSIGVRADQLEVSVGPSAGTRYTAGHLEVQQWSHLAVTIDASAQRVTLYLAGRLVGVAPWPAQATVGHPGRRLELGGRIRAGTGAPFEGRMDSVRIYGYALSAVEVRALALPGPVM